MRAGWRGLSCLVEAGQDLNRCLGAALLVTPGIRPAGSEAGDLRDAL